MVLSDLSIKRPVLATVMSLFIILLGIIAFQRLSVREYPKIDTPVVSVRTVYQGASAQVIESQITQPLEDSLSGIEGIRSIKSVSREEVSQINIEFVPERDVDAAANDVRDRVARARGRLPEQADQSVVAKIEADAQAVMWIAFFSEKHSALEVTDFAERYVADRFKAVPGVANVMIGGERRYAMRVWLERERLAGYGLTVQDVELALRAQNVEIPSGRVESQQREFTVLTETDLRTPEQFGRIIVREVAGYPVRLSELAHIELGAEDERSALRINSNPAVGLGIVKQSTANTLEVARKIKALLPEIRKALPPGMDMAISYDSSIFIEESISAVYSTMFEALLLVVLVIFVFLRSLRATLIPFVTIPVSLIGAFFFLYTLDFSINTLTLLGLVLAIGLVVDDAIVVLENIYRHIEAGMKPMQAAVQGSREIAFAVIAMTFTLAAVFTPLAFMTGNTGRLFTEFALTVAAAVVVSGFVALTLSPMMCSRLLRHQTNHGRLYVWLEHGFIRLTAFYQKSLRGALSRPRYVTAGFLVAALSAGFLYTKIPSELAPVEDRSFVFNILLAPEGATLAYTDQYARQWEQMFQTTPEVKTYAVFIAPGLERPNPVNFAMAFVNLKPWSERERSQQAIVDELGQKMFMTMPGVLAFPISPPSLGQNFRNQPLQFVLQGNSYEQLAEAVGKMMTKLRGYPGLMHLDSDLKLDKPQLVVDVARDKLADIGIPVNVVGQTLETLLGGREVTRFKRDGKQYDVIVQLRPQARANPEDITSIYVRNAQGELVQLSNVVSLREGVAPKELNHFDRVRAAIISASLTPGYTLGQVLDVIEGTAKEVLDGSSIQTTLDGQSREFREASATLYLTFVLALAFIYLVLAAQFESFLSPVIIMLTVPLAMAGALLALYVTGQSLNVYSQIGLVMLVGLITKHGILLVDFANKLRAEGRSVQEAVLEAASLRLRPILMTTAAMVLGALPLAFAVHAGAESRRPIGWVIVGGLLLGTLLTLYVIPTVYVAIHRQNKTSI